MILTPTSESDKKLLAGWLAERLPEENLPANSNYAAVIRGDKIAAVIAYYNYSGGDIHLSFASDNPRWATRQTVSTLLGMPFEQLGCRRITILCKQSNEKIQRMVQGLGFVREGRHNDLFEDGPGLSFGMTRRWFQRSKWNGFANRR